MPIRAEMKARYSSRWAEIRERIRARAGNRCEWCGVANHAVGYRIRTGPHAGKFVAIDAEDGPELQAAIGDGETIIRIVCTTAHVHDKRPEADSDDNLAFLCQRCHNRHDAADRARGIRQRREAAAGVQRLFEEE